jgi:hypothetical protein
VDVSKALALLPSTQFRDTGGSNGHIAQPDWLAEFVASLNLPGRVTYATLRKLPPFQGIPRHVDKVSANPSVHGGTRYHVPLVTDPDVLMRWPADGVEVYMEPGFLYEFDHTREHEVVHRAPVDRVHLVVNCL